MRQRDHWLTWPTDRALDRVHAREEFQRVHERERERERERVHERESYSPKSKSVAYHLDQLLCFADELFVLRRGLGEQWKQEGVTGFACAFGAATREFNREREREREMPV
jgi:hypothetical protein